MKETVPPFKLEKTRDMINANAEGGKRYEPEIREGMQDMGTGQGKG